MSVMLCLHCELILFFMYLLLISFFMLWEHLEVLAGFACWSLYQELAIFNALKQSCAVLSWSQVISIAFQLLIRILLLLQCEFNYQLKTCFCNVFFFFFVPDTYKHKQNTDMDLYIGKPRDESRLDKSGGPKGIILILTAHSIKVT